MIERYLLATSAFPIVCDSVGINGDYYIDGGTSGNTPVYPVKQNDLRKDIDMIIIVTLSYTSVDYTVKDYDFIQINPSEDIGGLFTGTLNFDKEKISYLIDLGYNDTVKILKELGYYPVFEEWFYQ